MRLIALDFETTGLDPFNGAEIIEIGAYAFDFDDVENGSSFSRLCKPKKKIPAKITKINSITNRDVKHANPAWNAWIAMLHWAGEFDAFVAHNAPFEAKFVAKLYHNNGAESPNFEFIDTLKLARRRVPDARNHKLVTLAKHFNIELVNAHRALDDAKASAYLLGHIAKTYKNPASSIKRNLDDMEYILTNELDKVQRKLSNIEHQNAILNAVKGCIIKGTRLFLLIILTVMVIIFVFG